MWLHVLHWLDVRDRIKFHLCVSLSTSAYMEWHLVICQSCADQFLHFKDDVTCVLLVAGILTFLVSDLPLKVICLCWSICLELIT